MADRLNSVELFAGGGGMALGLRAAGFTHSALVEWWAPAAKVLRHNADLHAGLWARSDVIEDDVRCTGAHLSSLGPIELVAGGPPCQPFSLAGAGAGVSDERNMFPAALDVVRRLQPDHIVFENVPGLLRASFSPYLQYVRDQLRRPMIRPMNGELWDGHHKRILASRHEDMYVVDQQQIDAADLGVAQNRRRVFIVATRVDIAGSSVWHGVPQTHSRDSLLLEQWVTGEYWDRHDMKMPKEAPDRIRVQVAKLKELGLTTSLRPWRTLRDLLSGIPEPIQGESPEGWPNHSAIPGARTYAKHNGSPIDLPSKTIKAGVHGVAGGEAMLRDNDGSVRYFTIREAALIQGFPTNYEFPGPRSRVMGVIGNAVAVDVAREVGRSVLSMRKKMIDDQASTDYELSAAPRPPSVVTVRAAGEAHESSVGCA